MVLGLPFPPGMVDTIIRLTALVVLTLAALNALQAGSAAEEGVGGNPQTGTNYSALVFTIQGDAIECGGGAEIYDDARPAIFLKCGHRINDTVCTDFGRIVIKHWHAGLDAGLDEQRFAIEVTLANFAQSGIERRHYRRDHDTANIGRFEIAHGKQVAKEHAVFIHRLRLDRRHAPVRRQALV